MLGSTKNSIETTPSRPASLIEASFSNALVFEFMLLGMTLMEAAENKLSWSFALAW